MIMQLTSGDAEGSFYGLVSVWLGKTFNVVGNITASAALDAAIITLIGVVVGFVGKRVLEYGEKKTLEWLSARKEKNRKKTQ